MLALPFPNMWKLLFLLLICPANGKIKAVASMIGRQQTIGVRGQLLCGKEALNNTKVKLWDEDSGPDPDDLLDEIFTNETGHFELSGTQNELTNIDPRLNIYHNCDKEGPCKRKVTFFIPSKFISNGAKVNRWFDLGSLNMQIITKGEVNQCF